MKQILIAEDNEQIRDIVKRVIEMSGKYQAHKTANGTEAFEYLRQNPIDGIVTDFSMPPSENGLILTQKARESGYKGPIVLFCGQPKAIIKKVLDEGADIALDKPNDFMKISETLDKLLGE